VIDHDQVDHFSPGLELAPELFLERSEHRAMIRSVGQC
jgi:hypothetical protein